MQHKIWNLYLKGPTKFVSTTNIKIESFKHGKFWNFFRSSRSKDQLLKKYLEISCFGVRASCRTVVEEEVRKEETLILPWQSLTSVHHLVHKGDYCQAPEAGGFLQVGIFFEHRGCRHHLLRRTIITLCQKKKQWGQKKSWNQLHFDLCTGLNTSTKKQICFRLLWLCFKPH